MDWPTSRQNNQALFLLIWLSLGTAIDDCPSFCTCKWKDGKETTECQAQGLTDIPAGIHPGTQVLNLDQNDISVLPSRAFLDLRITNLQRIFLSDCLLSEISPNAFQSLTNLVELDLGSNRLHEVPSESWKHSVSLMRLQLSANPIKLIRRGAFGKLRFLTYLDLSGCHIETIEDGAFDGMDSLKELKLEGNRLNYLHSGGIFPKDVTHVEESG